MSGKMSNRDRIARMQQEADAARKAKQAAADRKSAAGESTGGRKTGSRPPARPARRTRVVWVVCDRTGSAVKTYPYPQEQAARADAERLAAETGKAHFVKRDEVPFE